MSDDFVLDLPSRLSGEAPIDVALILGSGLAGLGDRVEAPQIVPFSDIDGFPRAEAAVAGHAGRLIIGGLGGKRVACFQGRIHRYQGFSARDVVYPVRLAAAMGAKALVVTNAAGSVADHLTAGELVLLSDQINLTGDSPLVGWPGPAGGTPFVPMRDAFDPGLRQIAIQTALDEDVPIEPEGVYCGLLGPAYETPAEVAMLRTLGADLVGMSTVPEVIAARALDLSVLGISLVTNVAAGTNLSHEEVLEVGRVAAERMERLVIGILHRLS